MQGSKGKRSHLASNRKVLGRVLQVLLWLVVVVILFQMRLAVLVLNQVTQVIGLRNPDTASTLLHVVFQQTVDPKDHAKRSQAIIETHGALLHSMDRLFFIHSSASQADDHPSCESCHSWTFPTIEHSSNLHDLMERALQIPGWKWMLRTDDITFVVLENVLRYIENHLVNVQDKVHFVGHRFSVDDRIAFMSGGGGWLLSRAAVERWNECPRSSQLESTVDCVVQLGGADAARHYNGFRIYDPVRETRREYDSWYVDYTKNDRRDPSKDYPSQDELFLTFHYVEPPLARFLHEALGTRREALKALTPEERNSAWPGHVGGHARTPNLEEDEAVWKLLLETLPENKRIVEAS